MKQFFKKLLSKLINKIFPPFYNKITRVIVYCGLGLMGTSLLEKIVNLLFTANYSISIIDEKDPIYGIILIIIALAYNAICLNTINRSNQEISISDSSADSIYKLKAIWDKVNDINCNELIGPDVRNIAEALQNTAISWKYGLVSKDILMESYFDDYKYLYEKMANCDNIVPGYEDRNIKCKDLIDHNMEDILQEMEVYNNDRNNNNF